MVPHARASSRSCYRSGRCGGERVPRIRREALDRRRHRAFHGAGARDGKNCQRPSAYSRSPCLPVLPLINFMLSVNLVLVAYSLTFIDSIMTVPLFFMVCLVLH